MQIIGYIFLFYVAFYFYRLAENHKKNKWVFAFLGLATYFFGYLIYILYYRFFVFEEIDDFSYPAIGFKSSIIGFVFTFLLFQILSFVWSKKKKNTNEVDKIGKR